MVYSCGESQDSNPIIASLNPGPQHTIDGDQSYHLISSPKEPIQKNLFGESQFQHQSDGKDSSSNQEFRDLDDSAVELSDQHCSDAGGLLHGGVVGDQVHVDDLTHVEGDLAYDQAQVAPVAELQSSPEDFSNARSGVVQSCADHRDGGCGGHWDNLGLPVHVMQAFPTTSTPWAAAPSASSSPGSPHGAVRLPGPITTSPLISTCKTSAPFLSHSSNITPLSAIQHIVPSLPLNEALLSQTKQAPSYAVTAVVGMAGEEVGRLCHVLQVSRPSGGEVLTSAGLGPGCGEVVMVGLSGGNNGSTETDCLGGNTGIETEYLDTRVAETEIECNNTGSINASGHSKSVIIKESLETDHMEPNTGSLRGSSTSIDNSTCPKDLAWKSSQNVCRSQGQCKQLPSDLQKCFEASKCLPKGDIISLAEPTAGITDCTHSPRQTIDAFILEGGEGEEEEVGSGSSTSVHMASILLSQLESELTNSLNKNK